MYTDIGDDLLKRVAKRAKREWTMKEKKERSVKIQVAESRWRKVPEPSVGYRSDLSE